jgi:F-type H+-transporting ATPase subunit alpha
MENPESLLQRFREQLDQFQPGWTTQEIGSIIEVGDGIATVSGLPSVQMNELVEFENGVMGLAFNLETAQIGVIVMGDFTTLEEGMSAHRTGRIASVPVGDALLGRVVNALGQPQDGKGPILTTSYLPVERIAAGIIERQDVDTPLQTGLKAIDALIPIGRGQRELIIGDRQTGKTAIALDTIINQKGSGVLCIYVAIGQKQAQIARVVATLEEFGAMDYTVVISAPASDPAALQYLAPYAGCAIGEDFMEHGRDALIIYDDLTRHAWAYRQVSLLLRRPAGREAYPGDIFYLHSRLLERAARLANHYIIVKQESPASTTEGVDGQVYIGPMGKKEAGPKLEALGDGYEIRKKPGTGGSLTALPLIETQLGDVSAYIPTNVISITDGQIYLESSLFNVGIRPAINIGISVSRVGGDAQSPAMKKIAGPLKLSMAQFRELEAFARFGADLDDATKRQLDQGARLTEVLKQGQYRPLSLGHQVAIIYAAVNGFLNQLALNQIQEYERNLHQHLDAGYPTILHALDEGRWDKEIELALREAITAFNALWVESTTKAAA